MTAQLEHDDRGPIWFFAAKDNAIVQKLRQGDRVSASGVGTAWGGPALPANGT